MERERDDLTEAAVGEALGEEARAQELRSMAKILSDRFFLFKEEYEESDDPARREKLKKELIKLREQIHVLSEEADITQFVEDAVRLGVEMRRMESGEY